MQLIVRDANGNTLSGRMNAGLHLYDLLAELDAGDFLPDDPVRQIDVEGGTRGLALRDGSARD